MHARARTGRSYLTWPIDGTFVALAETFLALFLESIGGEGQVARRWPPGFRGALVLTHDVEGVEGQRRCSDLADLEAKNGFKSSFNFVAERYPLDRDLMLELQARGFEIGVHGIKHDGRKFSTRAIYEERLKALTLYRDAWKSVGFRSPATHRRWEWMHELPFEYDSSFPDTDPYEPIPGGCGTPWPFMLGDLVELPITMPQDHTLWEILGTGALTTWRAKLKWLLGCQGLINIIVHPDYLTTKSRWADYEAFLRDVREETTLWATLPRDVARWWRMRSGDREAVRLDASETVWKLIFG